MSSFWLVSRVGSGGQVVGAGRSRVQTRQRLLDVALPLFAQHGFAGTSIRMVAGSAEVNVATVAYHFGDKRGLYEAVLERLYADLEQELAALTLSGATDDLLRSVVREGWAFVKAHRQQVALMIREVLDSGAHPSWLLARFTQPTLDIGDALVARLQPDWTATERRLFVLSMSHLMIRFALDDETQLHQMLLEPADLDDTLVDWFTGLARRQLGTA